MQSASDLRLILPRVAYRDQFLDMVREFHEAGDDWPHGAYREDRRAMEDFSRYVREVEEHARGVNVPEGLVPNTTFWLMAGERMVGTLSLRHTLNEYLAYEGGHIGFCIRPSERRKGHMTRFLRLALDEARELGRTPKEALVDKLPVARDGLRRVLITCESTNLASAGVIRACGGVLEDERVSRKHVGEIVQRYWIEL